MSTQEQRERFAAWHRERYGWYSESAMDRDLITDRLQAWQFAEAAAIERCAKFIESRADEIAAAKNCAANMMAAIYRDEAKSLRALLPKEEG